MTVSVLWLFLGMLGVDVQCVIMVFTDHTHLLLCHVYLIIQKAHCLKDIFMNINQNIRNERKLETLCNSYTMGTWRLSYVQVDRYAINILYHLQYVYTLQMTRYFALTLVRVV